MSAVTLHHGDCLDVLRSMPDASVDAVVTDPPYGLGFMGKAWDDLPPGVEWARECLRVLKPGGHMLAFGGARTWHRLACAVEDAGFEVRDSIAWLYGSGFPKSLDVSKAIDKAAGAQRALGSIGSTSCPDFPNDCAGHPNANGSLGGGVMRHVRPTAPATPDARAWQGWGTALKPAFEPIVVARKRWVGTVAANVLEHGTGALNIDASRVDMGAEYDPNAVQRQTQASAGMAGLGDSGFKADHEQAKFNAKGRWPANVILDESQAAELDAQTGALTSGKMRPTHTTASREVFGQNADGGYTTMETYGDSGGASRFFYVAKAPAKERPRVEGTAHPTVKPLTLMRWLVRLVTPPGGTVLDPFAGSGTTVEACLIEGFECIAIEREAEYLPLIQQRIDRAASTNDEGLFEVTSA